MFFQSIPSGLLFLKVHAYRLCVALGPNLQGSGTLATRRLTGKDRSTSPPAGQDLPALGSTVFQIRHGQMLSSHFCPMSTIGRIS